MKLKFQAILFLICSLMVLNFTAIAQVSSGGNYAIEQKVVANGGGESNDSSGMLYKIEGTIGQNAAGTPMSGGVYTQIGGFWTPPPFAPTAAGLKINGRVVTGANRAIKNAFVTLTGGMLTAPIIRRTNQFGYFNFENVEAGHFYILTVEHKQHTFSNQTISFTLQDDLSGIIFEAEADE